MLQQLLRGTTRRWYFIYFITTSTLFPVPVPLCPSQIPCLPHILLIPDFSGLSRITAVTQRIIIFVPNNFKGVNFYNRGLPLQKCYEIYLARFCYRIGLLPVISHCVVERSSVLFLVPSLCLLAFPSYKHSGLIHFNLYLLQFASAK